MLTVAMMLLFLLGFMGIALDLGRLFIVKTELQTAMDSCALSAAQELDGTPGASPVDSISRAKNAGRAAANLNSVNLQSANWDGKGQVTDADITFRDANFSVTTDPVAAKYADCEHVQPGVRMWLLQAMGVFHGDTGAFPAVRDVAARAVATRSSAQTTCPVPVALKPKLCGGVQCPGPNYGFTTGEWVTLIMAASGATNGEIGWANLDGSNDAAETVAEMEGHCGTVIGDTLGTPGVQTAVADVWNYRFGVYKNNVNPAVKRPDFTGYAYTATNWPSQFNAYDAASPPAGAHFTAANFVTKRQQFASCADTGTSVNGASGCEGITGLTLNSFQKLAIPGAAGVNGHRANGMNRRLVVIPVINSLAGVIDFACMLMLQPLSIPMTDTQLEFRGNAGSPGSPCTTSGLPGGSAGPLVPVLVR